MSIFNDDRQYGSEEERNEWKSEVLAECRREAGYDNFCDERTCYSEDDEDEEYED